MLQVDRTTTVGGCCDWFVRRSERHVDLSQYTVRLGGRSTHCVGISRRLSSSDKHLTNALYNESNCYFSSV